MTGAIARWDGFLAQIQSRHLEVIHDTEIWAKAFTASVAAGGNTGPLSHHLMGVTSRLHDLEAKIIDTWHARVEQAIFDEGHSPLDRDREYAKGAAIKYALEDRRDELEPRLFAELARQRYQHAVAQVQANPVACPACGARRNDVVSFRAVDVQCSCGATIHVEPGDLMRSVAAIGAHPFAQEAAVVEWRAMRAAGHALSDMRPPRPLELILEYERRQIAFWRVYFTTRAQLEPELSDIGREVRARMEHWYTSNAAFEEAWVIAGRPRQAM